MTTVPLDIMLLGIDEPHRRVEQALGIESQIDAACAIQAAREDARAREEHERERGLNDHEDGAQA